MYTILAQQLSRVIFFVSQLLFVASQLILIEDIEIRIQSRFQQRVTWDIFIERYKDAPLFRRHLRMSYNSFTKLLHCIQEHVEKDEKMSCIRGGKIIPEVHLYATIRYLAGARLHNYCIDERLLHQTNSKSIDTTDTLCSTQLAYMRAAAEAEHRCILSEEYPQWSLMRQEMVLNIKNSGFERPLANTLKRKRREVNG